MSFFNKRVQKWSGWVAGAIAIVFFVALAWNTQFAGPADDYTLQTGKTDEKTGSSDAPAAKNSGGKSGSVYAVADDLSDGGVFTALLANTGVSSALQGSSRYTLFLPTNAAMRMVNTAGMSSEEKKRLVQYHIIVGRAVDADALRSGNVETLSRDQINFTIVDGKVRVNNSKILSSHLAGNGIVYLIDAVLLPPKKAW